jgi:hemerythrin-like domain-containing protein
LKRSPELRDLSEEHHYGLVAARNLRLAAEGEGPVSAAVDAFQEEWQSSIEPHFRSEEEVLLPQFAAVVGMEQKLIARTLAEHAALRSAVQALGQAEEAERRPLAAQVAQLLHDHIRFEERVLFPAVEAHLAGSGLQRLGEQLKRSAVTRGTSGPACRVSSSLPTR